MRYIKDFFYNFSDLIFAILVTLGIAYVLYFNFNELVNIEAQANSIIETQSENKVEEKMEVETTIPSNLTIDQLATILFEYKVIDNKEAFINQYKDKDVKIKSGNFKLKEKMDFTEIEKIIFEQK